jgi:hypothetical protein
MSEGIVDFSRNYRATQRNLRLDKGLRDAVADLLRQRWPSGTAKHSARAFKLSLDRAREAVAGRASLTTVEQIIKEGGPPVALPIIEAVWGGSLAHYFAELRKAHEDHGERLAALFGVSGSRGLADRAGPDSDRGLARGSDDHSSGRVGEGDASAHLETLARAERGARL